MKNKISNFKTPEEIIQWLFNYNESNLKMKTNNFI